MNAGILAPGYAPPVMPRPLLGQPQPVPTPYGRSGDPYWDNVSLLLRMDGPHGSRTFADLSKNRFTVTANGDAQITGQTSRFDQAAALDGTGDFLTVPHNAAAFNLGGDFTIEFWSRPTALTGFRFVFLKRASGAVDSYVLGLNGTAWTFWATNTSGSWAIVNGVAFGTAIANVWQHVAVVRNGSSFFGFLNGVRTSLATSSTAIATNTQSLSLGADLNGTSAFAGQLDECRLTNGVARYVSAFTPPTAPFPIGYQ